MKTRKKDFFSEKKKQKTFACSPSSRGVSVIDLARNQTDKSFLVLFFEKELLPALVPAA
jgi:hypothetical protein